MSAFSWSATFTDLRMAGIPLVDWIAQHTARRAKLAASERASEERIEPLTYDRHAERMHGRQ